MASRWLFVTLVIAVLSACGPSEPQLDFIGYPIINGQLDTSSENMAVVAVLSNFGMCTGTLIHHRVVLTAAHCIDDSTAADIRVAFGHDINSGGGATWRNAEDTWIHPNYSGSSTSIVNDMAMVRLSSLPPAGVDYIPHLPYSLRITSSDVGTLAEYVGFGQTDAGGSGQTGVKMTMTNDIAWVCYSGSCSGWGNPGNMNTFCEDQTPSGVCFGDSGGPAFIMRSGQKYTAGIASYVGSNCQGFGCHTKVDAFEAYILDFIGGINGSDCFEDYECDSGICADGVCCNSRCTGDCQFCDLPGSLGYCTTAANGYPCADSNHCNGAETCQNGVCTQGTLPNCDDGSVCTTDSCNPSSGCVNTPLPNGTSCSDNDICNGVEFCQGGVCLTSGALNCNDGNRCTSDDCHPVNGCSNTQLPNGASCTDNNECNGEETCWEGVCQFGTPPDCNDADSCTTDQCVLGTGCVHNPSPNGTACNDGDVCTVEDACSNGVCTGSAASCDDHNMCTQDTCVPQQGCKHEAVADGTGCGGGVCGQAVCSQGECIPIGGMNCDDGDACTVDWCDPDQGCMHEAVSCDDQNVCTRDACVPQQGCTYEALADGTGCGGGICGQAVCQQGECVAIDGMTCEEGDPCTKDWCDPERGCMHSPWPDGYQCGVCMMCNSGMCVEVPDCSRDGGCGCGSNSGGELPVWIGLSMLVMLGFRRRS